MATISPALKKLPLTYHREIGRVIFYYAHFEFLLNRVVYAALGVPPKLGRLAVRELRGEDQVRMVKDLLTQKKRTFSADLDALKVKVKALVTSRDLFAHGVWVFHNKKYKVIKAKGSRVLNGVPTSRIILPEAIPYDLDKIKKTVTETMEICEIIDGLLKEVWPSMKRAKPKKRSARKGPRKGRTA